jgi:hypothetical protein
VPWRSIQGGAAVEQRPGNDEEAADLHWSLVSASTMMNAECRRERRAAARMRWRIPIGLALVRLGLVVAPLTVDDIAGECPGAPAR